MNAQYGAADFNILIGRETNRKKSLRISKFDWKVKEKPMLTKLKKSCRKCFKNKYSTSFEIYYISLVNRIITNKPCRLTCHYKENLILNEPEEILVSYIGKDLRHKQQTMAQEKTCRFYPNYLGLPPSIQNIFYQNISEKQNLINKKKAAEYKIAGIFPFDGEHQLCFNSDFYKMIRVDENSHDVNLTKNSIKKINDINRDDEENSFSSIEKLIDKLEDVVVYNLLTIKENNSKNEMKNNEMNTKSNNENNFPTLSELKTHNYYNIESLTNTEKLLGIQSDLGLDSSKYNFIYKNSNESNGIKELRFINNEDFIKKIELKKTEMKKKSKFLDNMNNIFKAYFEEIELNEKKFNRIEKHNARLPKIQKIASFCKSKKQEQISNKKPNILLRNKNKNLSDFNFSSLIQTKNYKFQATPK